MQTEDTTDVFTINSDGYFEQYVWLERNSTNDLKIKAKDRAGNESEVDLTIQQLAASLSRYISSAQASSEAIELENMGSQAVIFNSIFDDNLGKDMKLNIDQDNIIYTQLPKFKGTTIPEGKVDLYINSNQEIHATTTADLKGDWQYQVEQSLDYGDHTVYATVTDKDGNLSQPSDKLAFTIKPASEMPLSAKIGKNLREFRVWWVFVGLAVIIFFGLTFISIRKRRKAII